MDVHDPGRSVKPYIAIAVGDAWLRSEVVKGLASSYSLAEYPNISRALAGCREHVPLAVLVSEELPTSSGYDFVFMLRLDAKLAAVPVVVLVAKNDRPTRNAVAQCGADKLLVDPFTRCALVTTVSELVNRAIESEWKKLLPLQRQALTKTLELFNGISNVIEEGKPIPYRSVSEACKPLVDAVASDDFKGVLQGVRDHDNYSYVHSVRVATYLALFGATLGLSKDEQIVLATGGLLHDVGKMAIPHEILNKPGRLDESELAMMKGHVTASVAYLQCCHDLPKGIITIAAQHHEKLDGSGYPYGLAGKDLNRLARIASIVDVFSALTDRRVYKPSMEAETALNLMVEQMGSKLDIKLLSLFRQMLLDATVPV